MGPSEEVQTFERTNLLGMQRYYFRIVDTGNNEILAPSQTYKTRWGRDKTARRLGKALGCPVVPEKPTSKRRPK